MSKKEKVDKEVEPEKEADAVEGEGAPKKGKKMLLIIISVVGIVAIGAGVYFSGILGGAAKGKPGEPSAEELQKAAAEKLASAPVYFELPEFLVNLNSTTGRPSFLKMSVTLELRDKAAVVVMDANKPRIIDTFNTYLRELRPVDIQGSAGIYRLRNELLTRLNSTIEEGTVKDILFGEIIVQ